MSTEDRHDLLAKVGNERRDFLKKIAIAAAFATPTIATFSLDGMRKKAFAQAAYDPPEVIALAAAGVGRAVVNFNQPMDTGIGADIARGIGPCRQLFFTMKYLSVTGCTWSGTTAQVVTFTGTCNTDTLNVTYNWGDCMGAPKFLGANGLELVPYSGSVTVTYCTTT